MQRAIVVLGGIILGLLFLWSSCKQKDEVPPVVLITAPTDGRIYSVYDTIQVSFQINDETEIVSASTEVVNMDFIPVTDKTQIQDLSGSAQIILEDKLIETGDYFLVVNASDGINDSRQFVEIRIIGVPKERRAVYVATTSGGANDQLWKVDSLFQQTTPWIDPVQDVLKLCVNSSYDLLALVGNYSTGIKAYDLQFQNLAWNDNVFPVSQTERYKDLICEKSSFYTTIYDREIRGYSIAGSLFRNHPTGEYRPELLYVFEDKLMVEENQVGDDRYVLNVYYEPSQALLTQVNFEVDITGIAHLVDDEILVFGNSGGQAKVFHYDIGENSWWEPRQLPTGKVYNAVKMEGGTVAFTHDDGVYAYTYNPNFLNLIRTGPAYRNLEFDVDHGSVIASTGNMLEEMSQTGQLVNAVSMADSIVSFDIHYTR